jgi:tetratricopeptide (TPR) repeat protein
MKSRIRTATVAIAVLVIGLSGATAGCGKYSFRNLKAMRAFKQANDHYRAQRWREAAEQYETVIAAEPDYTAAPDFLATYFFLGNSYDNLYKPARQGEPDNDAFMKKAIDNYNKAAELVKPEQLANHPADVQERLKAIRRRSLEYLVAAYAPDKLNDPAQAEPIIQRMIAMDPDDVAAYGQLSQIYEAAGRYEEAEQTLLKARDKRPNDPLVWNGLAGYYNRLGDFEKTMDAFNKAAELDPNNPQGYHTIGAYYQDKVQKDFRLNDAEKRDLILKGIAAEDKAISLNPSYMEAVLWKNILLRQQARVEKDPAKQKELIQQADELQKRAIALQKGGAAATPTGKPAPGAKPATK